MPSIREKIIEVTAREFGVSGTDIASRSAQQSTRIARCICYYLMLNLCGLSHAGIGRWFGRGKSAVCLGIQRIDRRVAVEPYFKRLVSEIQREVLEAQ